MSIIPLLLEFADQLEDPFDYKVCPGQITLPRYRRQHSLNTCSRPIFKRQWPFKPRHLQNRCARMANINFEKDGFKVSMDTNDFAPDEISVKTIDNTVIVEGKHEEKEDDHGHISRHFIRKYTLPKEVDVNDVISTRSSDGLLTIIAPPKAKGKISSERLIKIQHTGEAHGAEKGKETEKVPSLEKMTE